LTFSFSTFLGVSRQGEFKNTIQIFLQKVHVENFFQNIDKKIRCQFFLDFFCFIAFSGVSQRWEFKNTTKMVVQKNRVERILQKIRPKIQNRLFLDFFLSRFWAFLEEFKNTKKKYRKNKSDPSPLSYSDPPTHHGGPRLFFGCRPLLEADSLAIVPLV
jgi:hypothetical protein